MIDLKVGDNVYFKIEAGSVFKGLILKVGPNYEPDKRLVTVKWFDFELGFSNSLGDIVYNDLDINLNYISDKVSDLNNPKVSWVVATSENHKELRLAMIQ